MIFRTAPLSRFSFSAVCSVLFLLPSFALTAQQYPPSGNAGRTIVADIVALDQPYFYNRMGAQQPTGTVFALRRDVVTIDGSSNFVPGNVKLRDSKRPRPIVVRINQGDTLVVNFTNMLTPYDPKQDFRLNYIDRDTLLRDTVVNDSLLIGRNNAKQAVMSRTRTVGFHPAGLDLVGSIASDASWVGANANSLANPGGVPPGNTLTYRFFAAAEGSFLVTPGSDNMGMGGRGNDQLSTGLFGAVVVEPLGAEYYRSQVTNEDMALATTEWRNAQGQKTTPANGLPIINWAAQYSGSFWDPARQNIPILNMLKAKGGNQYELVCTDLTAVITGPNHGEFYNDPSLPDYYHVPASPERYQPFREFVIIYHESPFTVQAFPIAYSSNLGSTLSAGDDAFSINYGSGGIGAEIYANRIGVGPQADCLECAYEEFFLSAWAVGDPAMIVDVPANTGGAPAPTTNPADPNIQRTNVSQNVMASLVGQLETSMGIPTPGAPPELPYTYKASKALYPDDPSNVYHSYLRDHVKFRVLHGGGAITHVHHQHAHQWLHSPNNDDSQYLDSQILNPGEAYTLEMVYNGSGNRNQTVGDQIFHCHFYPHFAGGMWAMWRVHDVFESGTQYTSTQNLVMAPGARALPDAEITTGTPIPGLIPLPMLAMAPVPGAVSINNAGQVVVNDTTRNPGFPFFIPGVAGRRPPHPPLDFAVDTIAGKPSVLDGGLPRHVIVDGVIKWQNQSKTDWTKIMAQAVAIQLPETGTQAERVAMKAHATRYRPSITPEGKRDSFIYNGLPPAQGAPYADPAIDDNGNAVGKKRIYKGANIQMDVVFNKEGWHYPQQRFITLWGDVASTLNGTRPPQPFFFRANSDEYVEYWHTNLVPEYYELDDYQVRTPTDILGQHIHLVKFDVTSSDGAANGFNYEDGTFSPGTVQERIAAINRAIVTGKGYYLYNPNNTGAINNLSSYQKVPISDTLSAKPPNPIWGGNHPEWFGAQTTVQRWYADPLLNNEGEDRTLRTVFTHDHFGPSTHQQAGLYAGLLVEPENSTWIDPVTGEVMGQTLPNRLPKPRPVTVDGRAMMVADGGPTGYQANIVPPNQAESYREFAIEFQDIALAYTAQSRTSLNPYPAIPDNAFNNPTFKAAVAKYTGWGDPANAIQTVQQKSVIQLVVGRGQGIYSMNYRNEPLPLRVTDASGNIAPGQPGDLAYAFQSRTDRANPHFNVQPTGGAHINPADPKSAIFPRQPISSAMGPGDPYTPLFRAYDGDKIQIRTLVGAHMLPHFFNIHGTKWQFEPSNPVSGFRSTQSMGISEHFEMLFELPHTGNAQSDYLYMPSADQNGLQWGTWGLMRSYANNIAQLNLEPLPNNPIQPGGPLVQSNVGCPTDAPVKRDTVVAVMSAIALKNISGGRLFYNRRNNIFDNNGLFLVRKKDLNADGTLKNNVPVEPLVLRYNAGDCIQLTLVNQFNPGDTSAFGPDGGASVRTTPSASYAWNTSANIGLSPTLLSYDVATDDGFNVGSNPPTQTAAPGASRTYNWYAGHWERDAYGSPRAVPVEFGSVVLSPADLLQQPTHGMEGAIIIEPAGARWVEDANSRASAMVYGSGGNLLFREFVLIYNDNVNDSIGAGIYLANYGTENMQARYNTTNNSWLMDLTSTFSNSLVGEPETPVFAVRKGTPTRIHLAPAQGSGNGAVFELHGHVWQEEPYVAHSTRLGNNSTSEWKGTQGQVGALNAFEILLAGAGGANQVPGDYLYRSLANGITFQGFWGLMRVTDGADVPTVSTIKKSGANWTITGNNTVNFDLSTASSKVNVFAPWVTLYRGTGVTTGRALFQTVVNPTTGKWTMPNLQLTPGQQYTIASTGQGKIYGMRTFTLQQYGAPAVKQVVMMMLQSKQLETLITNPRDERFMNLTKPATEN